MRSRSNSAQSPFNNRRRNARGGATLGAGAPPPRSSASRLAVDGHGNLLVGTLHGAATDSIAQPQIFVVTHACGILTVVADRRLQTRAQFLGFRPQTLPGGDHVLHLASP